MLYIVLLFTDITKFNTISDKRSKTLENIDRNNNSETFYYDISTIREFLQLLSVVNIDDIPRFTINNLAGILLKNVESIEKSFQKLL